MQGKSDYFSTKAISEDRQTGISTFEEDAECQEKKKRKRMQDERKEGMEGIKGRRKK